MSRHSKNRVKHKAKKKTKRQLSTLTSEGSVLTRVSLANSKNELTAAAQTVLESRYLLRSPSHEINETPDQLFYRVAKAVSSAEKSARNHWCDLYYEMMRSLRFLPNSPTLMNAGKDEGQLSACFVLPIEDSLDSIFNTLKASALIHQSGGGTGFSFSRLRAKGSRVKTTQGVASGPVSFIRLFDSSTDVIKQGGARRGANMAVLRVDHPDIIEFIESKIDQRSLSNFNISVGITNDFMRAFHKRGLYDIVDPLTKKVIRRLGAEEVFGRIVHSAWRCGDPGLVFIDRMNLFNPTPLVGAFESTNPCGEQPLLPFESCNLGSLNLGCYFQKNDGFNWNQFEKDIQTSVRFLDNVIDVNHFPIAECESITLRNRKIGLGVMGFSDLLLMSGIPYASDHARQFGERVMSFLDRKAKEASAELAQKKGAFPHWKGSLWDRLGYPKLRNATVSTVAPTGTISLIAGASSGIEPIYSAKYTRNVLSGAKLTDLHPSVGKLLREKLAEGVQGTSSSSLTSLSHREIASLLGNAWSPAYEVSLEDHIAMQATFQKHSDSAVSKTINLSEDATEADVARAYLLAYQSGCKGITVYRDKSKPTQVLESVEESQREDAAHCALC